MRLRWLLWVRQLADRKGVHPIHGVWTLFALIALAWARWILPAYPEGLFICPSRELLGIRCPTCGAGTALIALSELRFLDALLANPLMFLGGGALCLWGLAAFAGYIIRRPLPEFAVNRRRKSMRRWGLVAAVALNWSYEIFLAPKFIEGG